MSTSTSLTATGSDGELPALAARTLCEAFQITADAHPNEIALRAPGGLHELTWRGYTDRVAQVAAGLKGLGVRPGDTVALMLTNRPEFHVCDMAVLHVGATPFSVYNTFAPQQIRQVWANAGSDVVITERRFLDRVRAGMPGVRQIVIVDGENDHGDAMTLEEMVASGDPMFDLDASWRAVQPDDLLTIIYTSGTTGPPKGVELTHASMLGVLRSMTQRFSMRAGGRAVSHLPAAHIGDRWAHYYWPILLGATVTCVPDPRDLGHALVEARPTYFGAVPRTWEKMMATLEASEPRGGDGPDLGALGLDECMFAIVGAAPTPPHVLEYFLGLGLPMCEVWGMSETSGLGAVTPPEAIKVGSVGPALPGIEMRLAPDGELLVRGGALMRGYRLEPIKTGKAVDSHGWLHTGDLAEIDEDGYVRVVDRKKDIIINASGKNMSPANIEAVLKAASPLLEQVVCVGDRRPYNVALVVPSGEALEGRSPTDPEVHAEIEAAIGQANTHLARVEQIKRFDVIDHTWSPGGDELTPTAKLKRRPIAEKYADIIDSMYSSARTGEQGTGPSRVPTVPLLPDDSS